MQKKLQMLPPAAGAAGAAPGAPAAGAKSAHGRGGGGRGSGHGGNLGRERPRERETEHNGHPEPLLDLHDFASSSLRLVRTGYRRRGVEPAAGAGVEGGLSGRPATVTARRPRTRACWFASLLLHPKIRQTTLPL